MEIIKKGKEFIIRHTLKRGDTYKISRSKKFESISFYKTPQLVKGYSSITEDNKSVLLIDYDNVEFEVINQDYHFIQDKFHLPPCYVFQTKPKNYHLVCISKFLPIKVYEILNSTRCDDNFKSMIIRNPYRSWVLRISSKKGSKNPKFIGILGNGRYLHNEISTAHKMLLELVYPSLFGKIDFKKEDHLTKIKLQEYET